MGPVHFKIETKFNVGDMNILYNGRQQSPRLLIIQCDALMERSPGVWGAGCKIAASLVDVAPSPTSFNEL